MKARGFLSRTIGRWKMLLVVSSVLAVLVAAGPGRVLADPLYIGYNPGSPPTGTTQQVIAGGGVDFDCTGSVCTPILVNPNDPTGSGFNSLYDAFVHNDQSPFKGVATIQVTNTGTQSWGDFHFQIFTLGTGSWSKPGDVSFNISGSYYPTYSNSVGGPTIPLGSVVVTPGTASTGALLDLYFDSNPVAPGQTAVFTVYTDNTTDQGLFGLIMYPSAVPIPGALWLLGAGLTAIAVMRKRSRADA
ncbi:MAG: VPLPA-CTERM sorting domain-containing protein [Syntrophorhabdales bacterium]|jgi:hypothetical protein